MEKVLDVDTCPEVGSRTRGSGPSLRVPNPGRDLLAGEVRRHGSFDGYREKEVYREWSPTV